jgi:hypothetical protein
LPNRMGFTPWENLTVRLPAKRVTKRPAYTFLLEESGTPAEPPYLEDYGTPKYILAVANLKLGQIVMCDVAKQNKPASRGGG